jgi:hypothetical protein
LPDAGILCEPAQQSGGAPVQYDNGEHKHACYIRLRQREDETFEPAWEPAQAADHFDAYKPFLFATVDEAINSWLKEIDDFCGNATPEAREFVRKHWEDDNWIFRCYVTDDGAIECTWIVGHLDGLGPYKINYDEDFLIEFKRQEIFDHFFKLDKCGSPTPSM